MVVCICNPFKLLFAIYLIVMFKYSPVKHMLHFYRFAFYKKLKRKIYTQSGFDKNFFRYQFSLTMPKYSINHTRLRGFFCKQFNPFQNILFLVKSLKFLLILLKLCFLWNPFFMIAMHIFVFWKWLIIIFVPKQYQCQLLLFVIRNRKKI